MLIVEIINSYIFINASLMAGSITNLFTSIGRAYWDCAASDLPLLILHYSLKKQV